MNKDIMPIDIVHRKFRQGLRGYVQAEVDEFLGQVADAYGKALEENERLKQEIEQAERALRQYREAEETIKSALVLAEKTADETRSRAQDHASLVLREAEQAARETVASARREAEQIAREAEHLRRQRDRFEAEFRALLETYLHLLRRAGSAPEPDATAGGSPAEGEAPPAPCGAEPKPK